VPETIEDKWESVISQSDLPMVDPSAYICDIMLPPHSIKYITLNYVLGDEGRSIGEWTEDLKEV
jgi:hypothetical protein